MRKPSKYSELFQWHKAATSGGNPARFDDDPQCGWYKTKLVKGGPWVPVRVYVARAVDPVTRELECDETLKMRVEGIDKGDPGKRWAYLTPITRREFNALNAHRFRDHRMMETHKPIDLSNSPTPPLGAF